MVNQQSFYFNIENSIMSAKYNLMLMYGEGYKNLSGHYFFILLKVGTGMKSDSLFTIYDCHPQAFHFNKTVFPCIVRL